MNMLLLRLGSAAICIFTAGCTETMTGIADPQSKASLNQAPAAIAYLPVVASAAAAPVEVKGNLDVNNAVARLISWHPVVSSARSKMGELDKRIDAARTGYLPKLNGGIDTSYASRRGRVSPQPRVSASQMIYDFGKVAGEVDVSRAEKNVGEAESLVEIDSLVAETANAFVDVQRYTMLQRLSREKVAGIERIADLVEKRSSGGAGTKADSVQAQSRVDAARAEALNYDGLLANAQTNLAYLLGVPKIGSVSANFPAWLENSCRASNSEIEVASAAVAASKAKIAEAEAKHKLVNARAYPTLSLEGGASYDVMGNTGAAERANLDVQVKFTGAIYDGSLAAANRQSAQYAITSASSRYNASVNRAQSTLSRGISRQTSLKALIASISIREKNISETRVLYEQQYLVLGTRTLLDLLNTEQEAHQILQEEANFIHDIRQIGVDCANATGSIRSGFNVSDALRSGVPL